MSDFIYAYVHTAESIAESAVQGIIRYKEATLEFEFRLDHTCYNKEGEDIGRTIYWKVKYICREGGSYVKVLWTPFSYKDYTEDWQEIADHDSCWRGCWNDILTYAREELIEKYNAIGNESWFFNCEYVKMIKEEEQIMEEKI